jgi:hypothetical protein
MVNMNKKIGGISTVFLLFLSACVTINVQQPAPTSTETAGTPILSTPPAAPNSTSEPALTEEALRNSEFLSPTLNTPIKMVNGEFSGTVGGVSLRAEILPEIQFGDLNRDGMKDAALLLAENTGGTGTFVSLVVIFSQEGKFKQAPGIYIDDRPIINSISIADGKIKIDLLVHGPNDPLASPSQAELQEYTLVKENVILTKLNSLLSGGGERSITIDAPAVGEEIGSSVRVSGSMPIAPFENTLLLKVLDNSGGELLNSAFMVQAAEPVSPATFDNTVALPAIPAGSTVVLILQESSMANGMPLAVNSVILKTK